MNLIDLYRTIRDSDPKGYSYSDSVVIQVTKSFFDNDILLDLDSLSSKIISSLATGDYELDLLHIFIDLLFSLDIRADDKVITIFFKRLLYFLPYDHVEDVKCKEILSFIETFIDHPYISGIIINEYRDNIKKPRTYKVETLYDILNVEVQYRDKRVKDWFKGLDKTHDNDQVNDQV